MDLKFRSLNSEQGQTVVEYILLLVVAISLVMTFYNSSAYRRLFGEQGLIGVKIKSQSEFSYRHAFTASGPSRERPDDVDRRNRDGSIHPSYADTANGETRFFGPQGAYGN
jgi:Flp pilus assembly pilin Flp